MKKLHLKIIGSTLIVGTFLLLTYSCDDSKDKEPSSDSPSSESSSVQEAPEGYREGSSCNSCKGTGSVYYQSTGADGVCPACNGKGFKWEKI